jgi:DnaJ-class molecular chaperone
VLGLREGATPQEIKDTYKALVKKWHPDKRGGDQKRFAEAAMAYGLLKTRTARRKFLDLSPLYGQRCPTCLGAGGKSKTKSITEKEFISCNTCHGAGYLITEESNVSIVV